jgi:signal transduction histidine kinase
VVRQGVLSVWDEPAVPNPPRRVWRDWVLVAALEAAAVLEGILRPDVLWRPAAITLAVVLVPSLLWRRTHPLAVIAIVFGSLTVVDVLAPVTLDNTFGLYTMAWVLLLPYALARWGSGRDIVIGLGITLGLHLVRTLVHLNVGDLLSGIPILLVPAFLGLAVRYWSTSRSRELDQVKMREREQLARELHDTVAHHVSAIVIQAQAGRVTADARPEAAVEALRVIEAEASLTLAEMRHIVGTLREGSAVELVPQRGLADLPLLATVTGGTPPVDVQVAGDVDGLRPSIGAAVYRLAQESITNAVRHARHATRIDVRVVGDADAVRLTVVDDGDPTSAARSSWGYGIVGMKERATLLGGTLDAGPGPGRGWTVSAVLPRTGGPR